MRFGARLGLRSQRSEPVLVRVEAPPPPPAPPPVSDEELASIRDDWHRQVLASATGIVLGAFWGFICLLLLDLVLFGARRGADALADLTLQAWIENWPLSQASWFTANQAYSVSTAVIVLVATISIAVVVGAPRDAQRGERSALPLHRWGQTMGAVSKAAASVGVVVALTQLNDLMDLVALGVLAALATVTAAVTVQRESRQLPMRLQRLERRSELRGTEESLRWVKELNPNVGDLLPHSRPRHWVALILTVLAVAMVCWIAAAALWLALAEGATVGGLLTVGYLELGLLALLVSVFWLLASAGQWSIRTQGGRGSRLGWGLPVVLAALMYGWLPWAWAPFEAAGWEAWVAGAVYIGPALVLVLIASLGKRGKGPLRRLSSAAASSLESTLQRQRELLAGIEADLRSPELEG